MVFNNSTSDFLDFLLKEDTTLHIPLIYIAVGAAIAGVLLLVGIIFCCLVTCIHKPEVGFVPRPVRRNTADIIRMPFSESRDCVDCEHSDRFVVELDEDALSRVNAIYAKRNYQKAE